MSKLEREIQKLWKEWDTARANKKPMAYIDSLELRACALESKLQTQKFHQFLKNYDGTKPPKKLNYSGDN